MGVPAKNIMKELKERGFERCDSGMGGSHVKYIHTLGVEVLGILTHKTLKEISPGDIHCKKHQLATLLYEKGIVESYTKAKGTADDMLAKGLITDISSYDQYIKEIQINFALPHGRRGKKAFSNNTAKYIVSRIEEVDYYLQGHKLSA